MELERLSYDLSVCRLRDLSGFDAVSAFFFLARTDEELSLVCRTQDVPVHVQARDDGWKAFRVRGILDFSLIGILAEITGILAEGAISVFAVSTYNTDYVLVKKENWEQALETLSQKGYTVL